MNRQRRTVLQAGGSIGLFAALGAAGLIKPQDAWAQDWNKTAFESKNLQEVVKALGGGSAEASKDITFFQTPDIAENGAVVPIGVNSGIPNTESIAILIEKNPNMLAASFGIPPGTEASVSTRVKMGQTSNVYGLVKAGGKYYYGVKEVKVTLGGCGG